MRVMMESKPIVAKNQIPLTSCIQVSKEATTSGLAHLWKQQHGSSYCFK